jgi:tRNA pseudouridine55 synthase
MSGSNKPTGRHQGPPVTGILVLDKPVGMSSMAAVAAVRRRAGGVKTGHAGTLDPLATGVLVIGLGRATKVLGRLMTATAKRYRTEIDLSAFTSTDDLEGQRVDVAVDQPPTTEQVQAAAARFTGVIEQRPPAHSAVKVGGRRAYAMARRGDDVQLPPRRVEIIGLEVIGYEWPIVRLDLHCAKGVYVRSVARDLGEALGTGGHCRSIRRTAVGPFTLEMAVALDDVPDPLSEESLIDVDRAMGMVERESDQASKRPSD